MAEMQDFLYSRPVFASFLKEYLKKYPLLKNQIIEEVVERIVTYLIAQRKPILAVSRIFNKILELARNDGGELLIVRYFNLLQTRNLDSIVQVSNIIAQNLNPTITRRIPSEDQISAVIYNTLKSLVQRIEQRKLRLLNEAKSTAIAKEARNYILYNSNITVSEVNEFIRLEKERQLEEYKQEYLKDNQARASMGLPLEYPDQEVIDEITSPIYVNEGLIIESIENLKKNIIKKPEEEKQVRQAQIRKLESIESLTLEKEGKLLKLSYIDSYIQTLIERTYEEMHLLYFRRPITDLPEHLKDSVLAIFNKISRQFVSEDNKLSALEVFNYILNITKTTRIPNNYDLEDFYLGRK
jgi:hypothetical protein